jgi:hypothetical protein
VCSPLSHATSTDEARVAIDFAATASAGGSGTGHRLAEPRVSRCCVLLLMMMLVMMVMMIQVRPCGDRACR